MQRLRRFRRQKLQREPRRRRHVALDDVNRWAAQEPLQRASRTTAPAARAAVEALAEETVLADS